MVNVYPLYSSSSGNVFLLENSKNSILIDAGVTFKALNDGLKQKGKSLDMICAIIITHEHVDHIKSLPLFCRKYPNIPVYACGKTADYIKEMLEERNILANIRKVYYDEPFNIKDFNIVPFEIPHDALMPCGFNIHTEGKNIAYATDLGHVSNDVFEKLKFNDFVVLESNYDSTLLEFGKYPYGTKRRIKGPNGHLSNDDCALTIAKLVNCGCNPNFILAHMSQNNNTIEIAANTINATLLASGIDCNNVNISYATKSLNEEVFCL